MLLDDDTKTNTLSGLVSSESFPDVKPTICKIDSFIIVYYLEQFPNQREFDEEISKKKTLGIDNALSLESKIIIADFDRSNRINVLAYNKSM